MNSFTFVTSNDVKLLAAEAVADTLGITIERSNVDFVEIQATTGEPIARDKAEQAYRALQKPVVVTDDSWVIPGLNGFPGPYMKQVNDWFTLDDWLHLTRQLSDRRIILRQIIVYQDATVQKLFTSDCEAVLLTEPQGDTSPIAHFSLISFDGGKHSAGEMVAEGKSALADIPNSWHDFCTWLLSQ